MNVRERLRARRLRSAEDELADAEYLLYTWGFSMRPSESRRAKERIEKAQQRLARLCAQDEKDGGPA